MIITLLPLAYLPQQPVSLTVERTARDRLRINGALFNFDALNEGDMIPAGVVPCDALFGPVERRDGHVCLSLRLPHGDSPDTHVAFPAQIIDPPIGIVDLPFSTWAEVTEERVEGGVWTTTAIHSWQQPDDVAVEFIADPVPEPTSDPIEEPSHVEP